MDKDVTEIDIKEILDEIKTQAKRLQWVKEDIQTHLLVTYHKLTLLSLSDSQILEFLEYLAGLPNGTLPPLKQPVKLPLKGISPLRITPLSIIKTKKAIKNNDNNNYIAF